MMVGIGIPHHQACYIFGPRKPGYYFKEEFQRMKKLTKTLSLVLVIAMIVSLCVVGVSAKTFKDSDKISESYAEAVDVMSGVGIIDGMTDGTFTPAGNFTRAQAAKIIAYMQLGVDAAQSLKATTNLFKDVSAGNWAAPYISYCAQMGIIAGYGNGNFGPTDALTGYQFAKMLLCAVGYGTKGEYNGANWAINVAKDALNKGVFDNVLSASTNSVITREQATQMAFNTLTGIDKVTYSSLVGDYINATSSVSGVTTTGTLGWTVYHLTNTINYATNPDTYSPVEWNSTYGYFMRDAAAQSEIVPLGTAVNYEKVGRVGYVWYTDYSKNTLVSNVYYKDTVVATKTDGKGVATWTDPTDAANYVGAKADTTVTYYTNTFAGVNISTTVPTLVKGDKCTLLDTNANGKVDTVLVLKKAASVVAAAPVTSTKGTVSYVTVAGSNGLSWSKIDATTASYPTDLAKDDVVLYWDACGTHYIAKANSFTGTVSTTSAATGTAVIGGSQYSMAAAPYALSTIADVAAYGAAGKEGKFYTEDAGYIIYVDNAALITLDSFVYVVAMQPVQNFGTTYMARLLKMDGTTVDVTLGKVDGVKLDSTNYAAVAGDFYTYTVSASGAYVLTSPAAPYYDAYYTSTSAKAPANGDVTYGMAKSTTAQFLSDYTYNAASSSAVKWVAGNALNYLGTSATQYLTYNATASKFDVSTGIAKCPTVAPANGNEFGVLYKVAGGKQYAVAVVSSGAVDYSTTAADEVYIISAAYATTYATATTPAFYTYQAIVNGKVTTINAATTTLFTAPGYYQVNNYTTNGYASSAKAAGTVGYQGPVNVTGSTLTYGTGMSGVLADSAAIWVVDATNHTTGATADTTSSIAAGTVNTLAATYPTGTFYTVTVPVSTTDPTVAAVYIFVY